jgi:hypothetical protein
MFISCYFAEFSEATPLGLSLLFAASKLNINWKRSNQGMTFYILFHVPVCIYVRMYVVYSDN